MSAGKRKRFSALNMYKGRPQIERELETTIRQSDFECQGVKTLSTPEVSSFDRTNQIQEKCKQNFRNESDLCAKIWLFRGNNYLEVNLKIFNKLLR